MSAQHVLESAGMDDALTLQEVSSVCAKKDSLSPQQEINA